jgi:predicted HicB family RNase H-like nuclease
MTLSPELQYQLTIAAQLYGISEQRWIEIVLQAAIDRMVSENPNLEESFDLH